MNEQRFEEHIEITASVSAIDALGQKSSLSRQKLKQAMNKGAVWLTHRKKVQRVRRGSKLLIPGQVLHLYYDAGVLDQVPVKPVLVEDFEAYSIWYKPYGLLSQGSKWGDHCTVTRWIEQNAQPQRPVFLIHRLDRAAAGLIMVGHSKTITAKLCQLFETRVIDKRYRAIVHGDFPVRVTLTDPVDGKPAVSHAELLAYNARQDISLVEVKIETGRKHQVRCHMEGCGHPIVGDRLYGKPGDSEDLQLFSYSLAFECPVSGHFRKVTLPDTLQPVFRCVNP